MPFLAWIQYLLDTCQSVADVLADLNHVVLDGWEWHFFVADRAGHYAAIEFSKAQLHSYADTAMPIPVLCNACYRDEIAKLGRYEGFGGQQPIQLKDIRFDRFVHAADLLQAAPEVARVADGFTILEQLERGSTQWSHIVDMHAGRVYFRTAQARQIKYVDMHQLDFTGASPVFVVDINQAEPGDVTSTFQRRAVNTYDHTLEPCCQFRRRCKRTDPCQSRSQCAIMVLSPRRSMMTPTAANPDDLSIHRSQASTIWENLPESKLEVIDGRLIAGNSLAGSRYLLWAILQLLGPRAVLALAPLDQWWSALATAFQAPPILASPQAWERWGAGVAHTLQVTPAGPHFSWEHHDTYSQLMFELSLALRESDGIALSIQRFVMRLGEDAYQPDLQCFRRDRLHQLQTYAFDGPADLVIEVTLPGAESADTLVKRRHYAAGGVPEYWIVDPASRTWTFLRLAGDAYAPQSLDTDGRYRSTSIPGLACDPARLWSSRDQSAQRRALDTGIFVVEPEHVAIGPRTKPNDDEPWTWDWRPLLLPINARPTPITFEQYLTWCPEAKFELMDGKPQIGGWEGTRNVLGLLLMTFGLEEAVTLLHPQAWVAALHAEEQAQLNDLGRRDAWWGVARQAAALLQERFGVARVAVIGDLLRLASLGYWSDLTLVAWGLPRHDYDLYTALDALGMEPRIDVRRAEDMSPRQRAAFADEAVDVMI